MEARRTPVNPYRTYTYMQRCGRLYRRPQNVQMLSWIRVLADQDSTQPIWGEGKTRRKRGTMDYRHPSCIPMAQIDVCLHGHPGVFCIKWADISFRP